MTLPADSPQPMTSRRPPTPVALMAKPGILSGLLAGTLVLALGAVQADPAQAAAGAPANGALPVDGPAPVGYPAVENALRRLAPHSPHSLATAPIDGLVEVTIGTDTLYLSTDGKYLIQGDLIDLSARRNLTEERRAALRAARLARLPDSDYITFKAPREKYRVTVFTDIDCGYCRKLHSEIEQFLSRGITVRYLAYPRSGIGGESYRKAVSVWCAPDRRQALTDAKLKGRLTTASCTNPVAREYQLGKELGVRGTPTIYLPNGKQVGGYLPAADLARLLQG